MDVDAACGLSLPANLTIPGDLYLEVGRNFRYRYESISQFSSFIYIYKISPLIFHFLYFMLLR